MRPRFVRVPISEMDADAHRVSIPVDAAVRRLCALVLPSERV